MAKRKKSVRAKNKKVKSLNKDNLPMGVKVVSVLYYIWAILWMLFGLIIAIGASAIITYLISVFPELATVRYGTLISVGIVVGILLIGLGILEFFVARGLWRLKSWARITAIILSLLAVINVIYSMTSGFQAVQLVRLIVDGGIVSYLFFTKEAKKVFK